MSMILGTISLSSSMGARPQEQTDSSKRARLATPQGLAASLRQAPTGAALSTGVEAKDIKKEVKKRDKRLTLINKDMERKKEKEDKEREKKEKEAEREREKKEKEERKRKEKEEKEALKAKDKPVPPVSPVPSGLPPGPSPQTLTESSLGTSTKSKRITMFFGKGKGGPGEIDLRHLHDSDGGFPTAQSAPERKEHVFTSLEEVLQHGTISDFKKYIKSNNCAGRLAGETLNVDGQTALHIACSRYEDEADPALVKYLIKQKGSNLNAKDNRQWTPLHCVCQASASPPIINLLVSAGADVTATNVDGTRPLDYFVRHSAKEGQAEIFGQALENLLKGNSINWKNPQSGETVLHSAIRSMHSGNVHTIKLLLARAADVSITNANGEAPLHYGVKAGRPDIVELLLSAGADPLQEADTAVGSPLTLAEKQPESPEKTYLIRQLSKQATIIKAQEAASPRQLLVRSLEEAREKRRFAERMLQAKEEEISQLGAQVAEEEQKEQSLQAEVERLKLLHQNLLTQRRRV